LLVVAEEEEIELEAVELVVIENLQVTLVVTQQVL
jgi:hypothetical protein